MKIQKELDTLEMETIKINKLDKQVSLINDDVKNIDQHFESGFYLILLFLKYMKRVKLI